MPEQVSLGIFIALIGLIATIVVAAAVMMWNLRGMFAGISEKMAATETRLSDKIDNTRHILRNEFQGHLGSIDTELHQLRQQNTEHAIKDAQQFAAVTESIALLRGQVGHQSH